MIGLLALWLASPAVAETVKEIDLLTAGTSWFYDDPITCKDEFTLSVTDDVAGRDYSLEVGILAKDGWTVESMDVTESDGRAPQIGGSDVVFSEVDCEPGHCGAEEAYPAPDGYRWVFYRSNPVPSADGDADYRMMLHTVMQVGIESQAVGSTVATYIGTDSWQHGDKVIPAYSEGTLEGLGGDPGGSASLDIVVSGGTQNTVVHSCSHAPGLASFGWLPLAILGLRRRRV